ncbi:hypothetical protein [Geomonas subterranea]|uniref:hypothetical protein n=1 Tax=Geomonas subterranea TaxID=2847989 RepID=UPI001CD79E24|nr:hypothetical protein [Geomonas fuzhouensis]
MKFTDVVADIKRLVGLELQSIKKGAEIIIDDVDSSSIKVSTKGGDVRSRSLSELEKVWKALISSPAVHVDSVLGGSGSSRNQPETIFANLPYVEFLYLDGKKHLALVRPSHEPGTLKLASQSTIEVINHKFSKLALKGATSLIVVTADLKAVAESMEDITGARATWEEEGIYLINNPQVRALLVDSALLGANIYPGTYPVVKGNLPKHGAVRCQLLERIYWLTRRSDALMAMEVEAD